MREKAQERVPNGPAAAAILSAAVGAAVIGILTTGAVISAGLKSALNWWGPAGPLAGKTSVGVIAWLVTWIILHIRWKDDEVAFTGVLVSTLVLLAVGLMLTFPPVFEAFE
jgi:hypothetical protein